MKQSVTQGKIFARLERGSNRRLFNKNLTFDDSLLAKH